MKISDKIVCITNEFCTYKLEIDKVYTVAMISFSKIDKNIDYVILHEDPYRHPEYQFISIEKNNRINRKEKLQKLNGIFN